MKRWALITVVLYATILTILAGPVILLAFWSEVDSEEILAVYTYWPLWVWVGTMALAQAALLVVPVRIAGGRPVTRRWAFWPFLAAFFLLLVMVGAMYLAVYETMEETSDLDSTVKIIVVSVVGFVWLLWAFLFGFYTGGREPKTCMSRIVKFLIAGSILELLVAVPTHIVARVRGYCSAGIFTFWGLAAGISVMLFAFGPAVFVLFVRRWASVRTPHNLQREEHRRTGEKE